MNDEEFARRAFAETFHSAQPKPVADLDLTAITSRGRRSARRRQGIYAAGTTALAGVVTVGVVVGPGLLRAPHTSSVEPAAGGSGTATFPAASTPASSLAAAKEQPPGGATCSTDLATLAAEYLPATLHATLSHAATCAQDSNGDETAQVGFDVPGSRGSIQITVGIGTGTASSASASSNVIPRKVPGQPLSSASLNSLQAKKLAAAGAAANGSSQPLSSAILNSLQAKKLAAAAAADTSSPAPVLGSEPQASCQQSNATETVCVKPVVKGSEHVIVLDLTRSSPTPKLQLEIVASSTDVPPLDTPQLTSFALSVASHF
jgi:hypothetical protein